MHSAEWRSACGFIAILMWICHSHSNNQTFNELHQKCFRITHTTKKLPPFERSLPLLCATQTSYCLLPYATCKKKSGNAIKMIYFQPPKTRLSDTQKSKIWNFHQLKEFIAELNRRLFSLFRDSLKIKTLKISRKPSTF